MLRTRASAFELFLQKNVRSIYKMIKINSMDGEKDLEIETLRSSGVTFFEAPHPERDFVNTPLVVVKTFDSIRDARWTVAKRRRVFNVRSLRAARER